MRKPSGPGGTTVAFTTNACADAGAPHEAAATFRSFAPLKGSVPAGLRVSSTRHGVRLCSDNPPGPGGAKYPFTSMTRSEGCVTNTEMSPFVPAGTMAALAVMAPVSAFSVETKGCVCPVGQVVEIPEAPAAPRCNSASMLLRLPECCRSLSAMENFCFRRQSMTDRPAGRLQAVYPPDGTAPWERKTWRWGRCPARNIH